MSFPRPVDALAHAPALIDVVRGAYEVRALWWAHEEQVLRLAARLPGERSPSASAPSASSNTAARVRSGQRHSSR